MRGFKFFSKSLVLVGYGLPPSRAQPCFHVRVCVSLPLLLSTTLPCQNKCWEIRGWPSWRCHIVCFISNKLSFLFHLKRDAAECYSLPTDWSYELLQQLCVRDVHTHTHTHTHTHRHTCSLTDTYQAWEQNSVSVGLTLMEWWGCVR